SGPSCGWKSTSSPRERKIWTAASLSSSLIRTFGIFHSHLFMLADAVAAEAPLPVSVDVHFGVDFLGQILAKGAGHTVRQDQHVRRVGADRVFVARAHSGGQLFELGAAALDQHGEVGYVAERLSAPGGNASAGFARHSDAPCGAA